MRAELVSLVFHEEAQTTIGLLVLGMRSSLYSYHGSRLAWIEINNFGAMLAGASPFPTTHLHRGVKAKVAVRNIDSPL